MFKKPQITTTTGRNKKDQTALEEEIIDLEVGPSL